MASKNFPGRCVGKREGNVASGTVASQRSSEPAPISQKSKISELVERVLDIRYGFSEHDTSPVAAAIAKQKWPADVPCPVIVGTRDPYYWKVLCQILDSALYNEDISHDIKEGFVASFLLGHLNDVGGSLRAMNKQHGTPFNKIPIPILNGVLIPKTEMETKLTEMIEYDVTGNSTKFFINGEVVYGLNDCQEKWYNTIITQVILLASKAITAPERCVEFASSRLAAFHRKLPIDADMRLSNDAADRLHTLIKDSIALRRVIVNLVLASEATGGPSTSLDLCIARASVYLKMTGLTGFKMVCQHVVEAKSPILRLDACATQVYYFLRLKEVYSKLGPDAPFVKFLCHPKASLFNPEPYRSLYNFAVGYASVTEKTMAAYVIGEQNSKDYFYILGREYGCQSPTSHKDVQELDMPQSRLDVTAQMPRKPICQEKFDMPQSRVLRRSKKADKLAPE